MQLQFYASGLPHTAPAVMPSSAQGDPGFFNQASILSTPQFSPGMRAEQRRRQQQQQQQQRYWDQPNISALGPADTASVNDIFPSSHSSDPDSSSSWRSEDTLGTPNLSFTPNLHSQDVVAWWTSLPSQIPQAQTPYQPMVISPAPQRPMPYSSEHTEVLEERSLLQFGPGFDMSSTTDSFIPSSDVHSNATATFDQQSPYNNSPPSTHERFPGSPYFSTPQAYHEPNSPALSSSAVSTPSRSTSMPRSSGPGHHRNRSRKLSVQSCNGPKPDKITGSPQPSSPGSADRSLTVSFVNFTPEDSHKILSGVAPSGSSKTKARREQEARERRRKLGEAALKAVRQAGGDIDALEAALC